MEAVRDGGGGGVEGERRTSPGRAEQRNAIEKLEAEVGGEERETTHEGVPESRNQGTSHDPGGSWLAKNPQKYPFTYLGVLLFLLPVIHWSRPEFPESTDLGGKRKENDRVRRKENTPETV
ncbi:hypothetical protein NDU88_006197 [Pleurodeles waltl]|uniref:Uncharacterized protein n=1 Tax=Pleurodeles waltl TaxID=8319 RepID=A0AAV7QMW4_PLEWA|nr:hypothetical protein NDU88_006197 [Pleurodeles waltl]